MAAVKVKRSDLFPVATVVKAYARDAGHFANKPSGTATAEATVDAAGALELTGLTADTSYVAYAKVGEEHRYLGVASSDFTEPGTLAERVLKRREEAGVV